MNAPTYPGSWSLECTRNPSGRAWWFVSRFVAPRRVEFINGIDGKPQAFRTKPAALAVIAKANGGNA